MARFTIILAVVFLVLLQEVLVSGWLSRRRRRCSYPRPSQGSNYTSSNSDYFYGTTSLWPKLWGKRNKITSTIKLKHSLLLFRGKIYEWGSKDYRWPDMGRNPTSCKISWEGRRGSSMCTKEDVDKWSNSYENIYGRYRLLYNNGHHYVNRLSYKLNTNCGH